MQLLSSDNGAKFRAAKKQPLENASVKDARKRRNRLDEEYRQLLRAEMLRLDPLLKSLLEKTDELNKSKDF